MEETNMKEKDESLTAGEKTMDRRSFLKGALATGAVAAGSTAILGTLAACGPQANNEVSGGTATRVAEGGGAASDLVGGAICPEDWLGTMPEIAEADISETVDVDVVILGAGHAGTQAALAAAQEGATVAVIEKQPEATYSYFGDDICSYNSQFMIEKGFGPYNTAEIISEYTRRALGRCQPAILKLFVENSGEMMDNMVSLVPSTSDLLDIDNGRAIIQIAYGKDKGSDYPVEQSGYKAWATTLQTIGTTNPTEVVPGRQLSRLTEIETYVMQEAIKLGATWYWEHSAEALVMDEDTVVGAYALKPDGSYLKLNAKKGVLLATGDFSSNSDMVYNLLDDVSEWGMRVGMDKSELIGMGRDGMGHKLGCWAGGAIEPHPRPSMNTMGGTPGPWGTSAFLTLNANGKRFMNEAMAQLSGSACGRQPLGIITAITDANFMDTVRGAGLDHGAPNWGHPKTLETMEQEMLAMKSGAEGAIITQVGIINLAEIKGGWGAPMATEPNVWRADTLDELLGYLGYDGEALTTALEEIKRYNELCKNMKDDDFDKDPSLMFPIEKAPFYGAVTTNTGTTSPGLVTLTGLLTDDQLNVMKADRSGPIKGLYAAGNTLGQRYGVGYSTPSAGNSMGMAMTHGRMAGKIIARS
jgi:succinate dehydrogenase/fumarate reductase flavoprotein subunit